jgi:uncharacterized membrane protein YczE
MAKDSIVSNMENSLFYCAGKVEILGSALTSVGAVLRNNNVHDETLTMLVGGVYIGAVIGLVNNLLPNTDENSSNCLKITNAVIQVGLGVAAGLTAPLVGENYLHYNTKWNETAIDYFTGAAIATAGAIVIGTAVSCVVSCKYRVKDEDKTHLSIDDVFGELINEHGESGLLLKGLRHRPKNIFLTNRL